MKNIRKDDLENLFQKRLHPDQIGKEAWNTPPMDVFDEAMSQIDKGRQRRRRRLLIWIIPFFILAGFTAVTYFNMQKIDELEKTIVELSSIKEVSEGINNNLDNNLFEDQSNIESVIIEEPLVIENAKDTESTSSSNSIEERITVKARTSTNFFFEKNDIENDKSIVFSEDRSGENLVDQSTTRVVRQQYKPLLSIHRLPGNDNLLVIGKQKKVVNDTPVVPIERKIENENTGLRLYSLFGIKASTIRMTNTAGADFTLTGYENYYADAFGGLGLEYTFHPKSALDIKVSYSSFRIDSDFENEMIYDKSEEYTGMDGNTYYDSDYDVYSVMGRQSGTFSLALDDKEIEDQESLVNRTHIANSYRTIDLSLGVLYHLLEKSNFELSLGAGLGYHHFMDLNEEMETSIFYENALVIEKSMDADPKEYSTQHYFSAFAKVRLGYKFSPQWGINVDLGSQHSLTSIRKTNGPSDPKTFINHLNTAFLIYYRF